MTSIDFANTLNADQLAAVTHPGGPQLVLAGAGSGKTRVITYRIAWLVQEQGVDPSRITAMTFTNKAANEMKERVEELLGIYPLPSFVGTFHRFALRLLRIYGDRVGLVSGFVIFDSSDQQTVAKEAIAAAGLSPKNFTPQAVLASISNAKNRLQGPAAFEREAEDFFSRQAADVYRHYQRLLGEANAVDFDDMIRLSVRLLQQDESLRERIRHRNEHLLVDEFQDTNHAQLALIHEIAGPGSLTAVGDEDQSIYRWRGAELRNILQFEESFPGAAVRRLERNYRSTQNVLDASGAVVENNQERRGKKLWTDAGAGDMIRLYRARDDQDEARWTCNVLQRLESEISLSEMAILVRTNAQTRSLEDELVRRKLPYALIGSVRFYERAEVKDLIAYLRLSHNPNDSFSLLRVLNRPARGIGKATQQMLVDRARERGKTPWEILDADDLGRFPKRGALALMKFRDVVRELIKEADVLPLPTLLDHIIEAVSYTGLYDKETVEGRTRLENIGELQSAAREFSESSSYASTEDDILAAFLDHVALASSADVASGERISLMTLHSAKGLEFDAVVLPGLEEDLLPHYNASGRPEDIEEERRLLYVGMTRAKAYLHLATASRRRRGGTYQDQKESRFLAEVPHDLLEIEESPELRQRRGVREVYNFFGRSGGSSDSDAMDEPAYNEPVYEEPTYEPEAAGAEIRRGAQVRHEVLGVGKVLQVEGSGADMRLVIYFEGVGRRKLLAKYANLDLV